MDATTITDAVDELCRRLQVDSRVAPCLAGSSLDRMKQHLAAALEGRTPSDPPDVLPALSDGQFETFCEHLVQTLHRCNVDPAGIARARRTLTELRAGGVPADQ